VAVTVKSKIPDEKTIAWFDKNVGPRTHYTKNSIGGKGWRFTFEQDNPWSVKSWYLTVDDEKYLSYYLLVK
jgi:hypothetical protein